MNVIAAESVSSPSSAIFLLQRGLGSSAIAPSSAYRWFNPLQERPSLWP